ncbi:MAG: hypothetical protein U0166_14040 [Acidobacteriota bacterium]
MRMARMQVCLPDDMYRRVKERGLRVSELLQRAITEELRRMELLAETDRHLSALIARVGAPSAGQRARAEAFVRRIARRPARKAG